jgi:hypothetical protein
VLDGYIVAKKKKKKGSAGTDSGEEYPDTHGLP